MVSLVQMFQTSDGAVFADQAAATAHEKRAEFTPRVAKYIGSREWKRGRGTLAANIIRDFLAFESLAKAA
jgi:hypothetical protein